MNKISYDFEQRNGVERLDNRAVQRDGKKCARIVDTMSYKRFFMTVDYQTPSHYSKRYDCV